MTTRLSSCVSWAWQVFDYYLPTPWKPTQLPNHTIRINGIRHRLINCGQFLSSLLWQRGEKVIRIARLDLVSGFVQEFIKNACGILGLWCRCQDGNIFTYLIIRTITKHVRVSCSTSSLSVTKFISKPTVSTVIQFQLHRMPTSKFRDLDHIADSPLPRVRAQTRSRLFYEGLLPSMMIYRLSKLKDGGNLREG